MFQCTARSFLGLCHVYCRFIKSFAKVTAPITNKLSKVKHPDFPILEKADTEEIENLRDSMISPKV